jgi:hypothetical protein
VLLFYEEYFASFASFGFNKSRWNKLKILLTYIHGVRCASNECKTVCCSCVDHCGVCSHFV